jgi:putative redox protein
MSDVDADLTWEGGTILSARSGRASMAMDWDGATAVSPVQTLAIALAGCMASDVVLILEKGRQPITGLTVRLGADRAEKPPRRLLRVRIAFAVEGDVAAEKVERAIQLSRDTYCSVWHSMARDIELTTSFAVEAPPAA